MSDGSHGRVSQFPNQSSDLEGNEGCVQEVGHLVGGRVACCVVERDGEDDNEEEEEDSVEGQSSKSKNDTLDFDEALRGDCFREADFLLELLDEERGGEEGEGEIEEGEGEGEGEGFSMDCMDAIEGILFCVAEGKGLGGAVATRRQICRSYLLRMYCSFTTREAVWSGLGGGDTPPSPPPPR